MTPAEGRSPSTFICAKCKIESGIHADRLSMTQRSSTAIHTSSVKINHTARPNAIGSSRLSGSLVR